MNKEDVVWLNNIEQELMEDKGWKLIFVTDHFNNHQWYEVKDPNGFYLDFSTIDIYKAINRINEEIEKEGKNGNSNIFKRFLS